MEFVCLCVFSAIRMMPASCLRCLQVQKSRASSQKICPMSSNDCGLTVASRAASHGPESTSSMTLQPSEFLSKTKQKPEYSGDHSVSLCLVIAVLILP